MYAWLMCCGSASCYSILKVSDTLDDKWYRHSPSHNQVPTSRWTFHTKTISFELQPVEAFGWWPGCIPHLPRPGWCTWRHARGRCSCYCVFVATGSWERIQTRVPGGSLKRKDSCAHQKDNSSSLGWVTFVTESIHSIEPICDSFLMLLFWFESNEN